MILWLMNSHRNTWTSQPKLHLFVLKHLYFSLSFFLYHSHISAPLCSIYSLRLSHVPSLTPTSISFCFLSLFLSLLLSALCCLLTYFTLIAASLITIEGWSQFSLFFLTYIYLWELVRPATWEINGGSNAIKYSQILYFPTFSLERSRYVGKKSHLELLLYYLRMSGDFKCFRVCISVFCHQIAVCMDFKKKHLNDRGISLLRCIHSYCFWTPFGNGHLRIDCIFFSLFPFHEITSLDYLQSWKRLFFFMVSTVYTVQYCLTPIFLCVFM